MLHKAVRLIAHRHLRIADDIRAILPPGQARHQIDVSIQQHLVEIAEAAVDVLVLPSGILGHLSVILIGIPCFDSVLSRTFLKNFVFIVADADYRCFLCKGRGCDNVYGAEQCKKQSVHAIYSHSFCFHLCIPRSISESSLQTSGRPQPSALLDP